MNAKQIKEKTAELLSVSVDKLDYITEESVAADNALGDDANVGVDAALKTLYGNNTRYGARVVDGQTRQCYYFDHGGDYQNPNDACGSATTAWALTDLWHHTKIGMCPNGREKWSFSR